MKDRNYIKGFLPYGAAALLVGFVGGFTAVLGPAFVQDLGLPYNNTTWTALATAMSSAACAPILGKLADVMGRRRTLLMGLLVYTLGNAMNALADSLVFMLAARFLVGIGTAAIAPVVIAYIVTEFPQEKMAKGFSLYMLLSSGAVVIGPTAGSWIIATWGWRAMMWLCTAVSAGTLVYCVATKEPERRRNADLTGFDFGGAVLVVLFFSLLLCVPSFGQNIGWNSQVFRLVLLGTLLSLLGLVLNQRRSRNPILPVSFMKRRAFVLSVLALFLTQGLMQANMTNTIIFVNYTQPDNTMISGFAISVMYIGMALGSVILGPLADRLAPKNVLTVSLLLTGLGCGVMLLFAVETSALLLMLSLGMLGFGLGGNGTIFMKVVLSGLPREAAGTGTGTYGLFRDLAAPFGVAVLIPMFTNGIAAAIGRGQTPATAAVETVHRLAVVEILCVAAGITAVRLLPGDARK